MHGYATINTIWTMMKLLFLAIRSFYHLLYTRLGPPRTISPMEREWPQFKQMESQKYH